jgi:hypothetical protein
MCACCGLVWRVLWAVAVLGLDVGVWAGKACYHVVSGHAISVSRFVESLAWKAGRVSELAWFELERGGTVVEVDAEAFGVQRAARDADEILKA